MDNHYSWTRNLNPVHPRHRGPLRKSQCKHSRTFCQLRSAGVKTLHSSAVLHTITMCEFIHRYIIAVIQPFKGASSTDVCPGMQHCCKHRLPFETPNMYPAVCAATTADTSCQEPIRQPPHTVQRANATAKTICTDTRPACAPSHNLIEGHFVIAALMLQRPCWPPQQQTAPALQQ